MLDDKIIIEKYLDTNKSFNRFVEIIKELVLKNPNAVDFDCENIYSNLEFELNGYEFKIRGTARKEGLSKIIKFAASKEKKLYVVENIRGVINKVVFEENGKAIKGLYLYISPALNEKTIFEIDHSTCMLFNDEWIKISMWRANSIIDNFLYGPNITFDSIFKNSLLIFMNKHFEISTIPTKMELKNFILSINNDCSKIYSNKKIINLAKKLSFFPDCYEVDPYNKNAEITSPESNAVNEFVFYEDEVHKEDLSEDELHELLLNWKSVS